MEILTIPPELENYWKELDCGFKQIEPVFAECMRGALAVLSPQGVAEYIANARFLGKMGRGAEPVLVFLEVAPGAAKIIPSSEVTSARTSPMGHMRNSAQKP